MQFKVNKKSFLIDYYYKSIEEKNDRQQQCYVFEKDGIYKKISETLALDSENLAIFCDEKLLKRNTIYTQQVNKVIYEVYNIAEMKTYLDCFKQEEFSLKNYIKELQQKIESYKKQQEGEIIYTKYYTSQNEEQSSQQLLMTKLIQTKVKELEELQLRGAQIKNLDLAASIAFEIPSFCQFCQLKIDAERLQTNCQHEYHIECFQNMVEAQINSEVVIRCICTKKLPIKMLHHLNDQAKISYLFTKIYQNQLTQILNSAKAQNFQIIKCPSKFCSFLCIRKGNNLKATSFFHGPYCKI